MFHSITSKIHFIFAILILLLSGVFVGVFVDGKKHEIRKLQTHYKKTFRYVYKNKHLLTNKNKLLDFLKTQEYEQVKKHILKEAKVLAKRRKKTYYKLDSSYFVKADFRHFSLLLKDTKMQNKSLQNILVFLSLLLAILFLYISILRSLKPLKTLQEKIVSFGDGDMSVSFRSDKKDEIAKVSNEFETTKQKIVSLQDSRKLFLRATMHELKTPIAKGMLVSEMCEDYVQKPRLKKIFSSLENLINEFATIEEIVSNYKQVNLEKTNIKSVIDGAKELLLDDNLDIEIEMDKNYEIKVDKKLFCIALKNLLDNAISYSFDKKVKVVVKDGEILISNNADKLNEPISQYFEPFHHSSKGGFGLGLYIVKHILDLHNMMLSHEHKEGVNSFRIR